MPKPKILIIDDNEAWHRLLGKLINDRRYEIQTAASCLAGVKMVEKHKPDCILLDFYLGDGDAVSVCSELRKNGKDLDIPVIVVSSDPEVEIRAYAECHAAYFVLKGSHNMMELEKIIGKVLKQRGTTICSA